MLSASETLRGIIEAHLNQIEDLCPDDLNFGVQTTIRRLDVFSLFYNSQSGDEALSNETNQFFNFGWPYVLKCLFKNLDQNRIYEIPETSQYYLNWADSAIFLAGRLRFCHQLINYEKAKLIEITSPSKNQFAFRYLYPHVGIEYFEKVSRDFFKTQIVEKIIAEKKIKKPFDKNKINEHIKSIMLNPYGKFISYRTTADIDEYYNQEGHYHMLRVQGYDDFDTRDSFGSIEYHKYVDIIELIVGVALMHFDACVELLNRNPDVNMHDILSYTWSKKITIENYSRYLGMPEEEVGQIMSCLTLTKENYDYYLDYPSVPPPMFFQLSRNQIVRSVAGCLGNPIRILNCELKRKYRADYDVAVNKREARFRRELFLHFPQARIVKIPNEVNISFDNIKTDVDAILYDTSTKTLGLFQLKWQDPFSHSMQERYSRITNLFPKAQEWILKVQTWIKGNNDRTILNALQVNRYFPQATEIGEVYVFILARNHMHFTGVKTDDYAAWASWYQFIEAKARVKTMFDDPIREMFVKLKIFSPSERLERDEMPKRQKVDLRFGEYRVFDSETST